MSLASTLIQSAKAYAPNLDKNMARNGQYGALDYFVKETESATGIVTDDLKNKAFSSIGNTVYVPVLNYNGSVSVSNSRSCVISDLANTSAKVQLQFTTYQVGFTMIPGGYLTNDIQYEKDFAHKLQAITRGLCNAIDQQALTALSTNKTQVYADKLNYGAGSVMEIEKQMAMSAFGDVDVLMSANNYFGSISVIGNAGIQSLISKLAQHNANNAVDKANEFGGKTFYYSNNITNDATAFSNVGANGTFYAVEDGNVGILTRVDRESLRGASANGHEWSVETLPLLDLPVGVHYYTAVGDQSASTGDFGNTIADHTCGVKEYFGFSVDVATLVSYNNSLATIANPIIKGEIKARGAQEPWTL